MKLHPFIRIAILIVVILLMLSSLALCAGIKPGGPQAQLFIYRVPTRQEIERSNTHAKFEPAFGCYLGAFIDFDGSLRQPIKIESCGTHQNPIGFEPLVGKSHAMYFFYMGYGRPLPLAWVRWLGGRNKFVHIAMEPNSGLDKVKDDAYLHKLADDMAKSGAKIFLRFASEMNGTWTPYHKDPALYRRKFRLVHSVMQRRAPNVAMVWCPYMSPTDNIDEYYPGDDGTDWVGVNLYNVTYHNNLIDQPAEEEHPCDLLNYVYRHYAGHRPMMICEFAASHYAACEGYPRPDFAFRKILTLYSALPRLYPRIKCINYFDSNNLQFVADRAYNDYSVTDDSSVNAAYRFAISSPYFLDHPMPGILPSPIPAIPMPMHAGETLRGTVRLSCWARSPSDFVTVRYKVDGYPIYETDRPDQWDCLWNAESVRPGKHILTLEVLRPDGIVVATQSLPISVQK